MSQSFLAAQSQRVPNELVLKIFDQVAEENQPGQTLTLLPSLNRSRALRAAAEEVYTGSIKFRARVTMATKM